VAKKSKGTRPKLNTPGPATTELVKAGMPLDRVQAQANAGMNSARPFGPGAPLQPRDGYSTTPRSYDFRTGINIGARPRSNEQTQRISFDVQRQLIESYDVATICIWHRIDSIRSRKWNLVPTAGFDGDADPLIALGRRILKRPDRKTRFKPWIAKYLYDVLAFDAGALYRMRNNAKQVIGLKVVDGTTIAPMLDAWGDTPDAPATAYQQFAQGVPWDDLTTDDLIYEPYRPTSNTPYGHGPIESVIMAVSTDIRFQAYFMSRFTDGNVPEGFAGAPEGWSPEQIKEFQEAWDAILYGDVAAKSQMRWVPHGTTLAWTNEKDFTDEFSMFLLRKTCAAFHVTPTDMGFTETTNNATADTQMDIQERIGDGPLLDHVAEILTDFLQEDIGLPLDFEWESGDEEQDALSTMQADEIAVNIGALSVSEVRERRYGLTEPDGLPVARYIMSAKSGPIPLSALAAVAGPIDTGTAAPLPGAPLPHKPFSPVEGVAPAKPPSVPALAVQRYPADNPQAADTAVNADIAAATPVPVGAPVVKSDGATAGITSATGVVGYDLDGQDDDDVPVVHSLPEDPIRKAVAAEMAAFRRFTKARRNPASFRDFEFTTVDPRSAHRLNVGARARIRKSAGLVVAAGLCVRAADTGRVLMLQRSMDPDDPAAGYWEFPGGCLEDGEQPLDAAWREWQEETGCLLPAGTFTGEALPGWTSTDGVYQGYVLNVDTEATIPTGTRGQVNNPDDPDGDTVEALGWFWPQHLAGNPAIRPELAEDIPTVLAALNPSTAEIDVMKAATPDPKGHGATERS